MDVHFQAISVSESGCHCVSHPFAQIEQRRGDDNDLRMGDGLQWWGWGFRNIDEARY